MAGTETDTGIWVPVGSDPYALTPDLLIHAKSINHLKMVSSKAERDALPARDGLRCVRTDLPGSPIHTYDGERARWAGPGEMDVQALTMQTGYASKGAPYIAPGAYMDGGTVFLEGTITNTATTTIASNSTVNLARLPDSKLYPLGTSRQRISLTIGTSIPDTDGYINIGVDGYIGVFLNSGVGSPAIGALQVNLAGISWRLK